MTQKTCAHCSQPFIAKYSQNRFCNTSCSAKWRMSQPEIRAKVYTKETALKISKAKKGQPGHIPWNKGRPWPEEFRTRLSEASKKAGLKPLTPGGNGRPLPIPVQMLLTVLPSHARTEHAISLGKRQPGYPTCYKVDIALVNENLAIEVDGVSHTSRRHLDRKKDAELAELGWRVLRIENSTVLSMFTPSK